MKNMWILMCFCFWIATGYATIMEEEHLEIRHFKEEILVAISRLSNDIQNVNNKITNLDNKFDIISGTIASIEEAADAANEKASIMLPKVSSFETELKDLRENISLVEKEQESKMENFFEKMSEKINSIEITEDAVNQTASINLPNVGSFETELKMLHENMSLTVKEQEIKMVKEFRDMNLEMESSIRDKIDQLEINLSVATTEQESKFISIETYITSLYNIFNNIIPKMNSVDQTVSNIDANVLTIKSIFHNVTDKIASMNSEISVYCSNSQDIGRTLGVINDEVKVITSKLTNASNMIEELVENTYQTTASPQLHGCPEVNCNPCQTTEITTEGLTVSSSLSWQNVGADRFVRFNQKLDWFNARALCRSHGLDLYYPEDIITVSKYLDDNFSNRYYWLGGRGNGSHQVRLRDNTVLTRSEPWYSDSHYINVGTYYCLYVYPKNGRAAKGTVLATASCTHTGGDIDVLCG